LAPLSTLNKTVWELAHKELREVFDPRSMLTTDQVQNDMWRSVFLQHRTKDEATQNLTWAKRIFLATYQEKLARYRACRIPADALYYSLTQALHLKETPFDPDLYARCRRENEEAHLARPLPTLKGHARRSEPTWPLYQIQLFLKNQKIRKYEKMGASAKPGQSVACFRAQMILQLGTAGRYLLHMIQRTCPPEIHIYTKETLAQLDRFVLANWDFSKLSKETDYERYDQSQREEFLRAEVMLMQLFNLPKEDVDLYLESKFNARVFLGELDIMRLSGEWCTFLFNTLGNIAYQHLRYKIPPGTAQIYAGDDSCINDVCPARATWYEIEELFALQCKVHYSSRPTFCSIKLTPAGLLKHPSLQYARLMAAVEAGEYHLVADSYFLDYAFSYRLGDRILDICDADELSYLQATGRYFHTHPTPAMRHFLTTPHEHLYHTF